MLNIHNSLSECIFGHSDRSSWASVYGTAPFAVLRWNDGDRHNQRIICLWIQAVHSRSLSLQRSVKPSFGPDSLSAWTTSSFPANEFALGCGRESVLSVSAAPVFTGCGVWSGRVGKTRRSDPSTSCRLCRTGRTAGSRGDETPTCGKWWRPTDPWWRLKSKSGTLWSFRCLQRTA